MTVFERKEAFRGEKGRSWTEKMVGCWDWNLRKWAGVCLVWNSNIRIACHDLSENPIVTLARLVTLVTLVTVCVCRRKWAGEGSCLVLEAGGTSRDQFSAGWPQCPHWYTFIYMYIRVPSLIYTTMQMFSHLQCANLYSLLCTRCVFCTWWRSAHCTRCVTNNMKSLKITYFVNASL